MTTSSVLIELPAGTWTLEPSETTVTVTVKKVKAFTITGTLDVTAGAISVADGRVTAIDVTADAGSYMSPVAKRNEHIASADFLDAENHPTITFSSSADRIRTDANGGYRLDGEVTIKGSTSPLTFEVSDLSVNDDTASFTATAVADRFDIGVDKLPAFVIAKRLDIAVTATARRT